MRQLRNSIGHFLLSKNWCARQFHCPYQFWFFIFITTVIFSVSLVSLIARRLHDFDCRALWAIVVFILLWTAAAILPSFGSAIAFLAMFAVTFKQGEEQANRFGASPAGEL